MKLTVSEAAKLTGISVRTLHYYDEIGLLSPAETSEAGYRFYDFEALGRLQQIVFYRELGFPLAQIQSILDHPVHCKEDTLQKHKHLLRLKQQQINRQITLVEQLLKGEIPMDTNLSANTDFEQVKQQYAKEAKQRWGKTEAYQESMKKASSLRPGDWKQIQAESGVIFKAFADNRGKEPSDRAVQKLVAQWQEHISSHYYQCTDEILADLGEMYRTDSRFTETIDQYGKGTALFMSEAIRIFSGK